MSAKTQVAQILGFTASLVLLPAVLAAPVLAQAFELSGGASTIYNAEGATLTMHGKTTETSLGGGFQDGHFSAGGATARRLKSGTETLGLQTTRADVPTDIFNQSHLLVGTGAGLFWQGQSIAHRELHAFAGFSSVDGGTPLFRSGSLGRVAAFAQWSREISENCRAVSTGLYLRQVVGLESIECLPGGKPDVHLAVTAGGGPGGLYGAASYALEDDQLHAHAAYIYQTRDFDRNSATWGAIPEPVRENISVDYRLSHAWSVSGLRQNFVAAAYTDPKEADRDTPRETTALEQGGLQFHWRQTSIGGSVLGSVLHAAAAAATAAAAADAGAVQGVSATPPGGIVPSAAAASGETSSNRSVSLNFEQLLGRLRWTEALIRSRSSQMASETLLMSGLELRWNPHLLLSETVNSTNGRISLAHGGQLQLRAATLQVDYELLYLANRPQQPFQQVTMVNASVRLWHALAAELASSIEPTGKVGYTVRLTAFHSHDGLAQAESNAQMGVNLIAGLVVDDLGAPVSGAALLVGATHLYTDDSGSFVLRERHATAHQLRVLTDEFLAPGSYEVVSAPATVYSTPRMGTAAPLRIVLSRRGAVQARSPAPEAPVPPNSLVSATATPPGPIS